MDEATRRVDSIRELSLFELGGQLAKRGLPALEKTEGHAHGC